MVSNMFLSAESSATTWIFVALLVVLVVVLLVVPMFTNKKRAKQTTELHNSLRPGDVVKTVGGIIGTIKEIRQVSPADKEMIIETGEGDNKTTMVFDIQALYQVVSRASEPAVQTEVKTDSVDTSVEPVEEKPEPAADAVVPVEPVAEQAPVADETPAEEKVEPVQHEAVSEQAAATEESVAEVKPAAKAKAASAPKKKPINSKNSTKK